jgi:alkanesulfonate monooxygenase SsuD/methylene tetrahydromethanopterin reductase-like flavin-dependent oxidoreductase (luciferase family)
VVHDLEVRGHGARPLLGLARPAAPIPAGREAALRADLLAGPPEAVAEGILAYERAAGVPVHFVARSWYPGLDLAVNAEALELLGEVRSLLAGG